MVVTVCSAPTSASDSAGSGADDGADDRAGVEAGVEAWCGATERAGTDTADDGAGARGTPTIKEVSDKAGCRVLDWDEEETNVRRGAKNGTERSKEGECVAACGSCRDTSERA